MSLNDIYEVKMARNNDYCLNEYIDFYVYTVYNVYIQYKYVSVSKT
ncbi:hypothetical protein [Clostridium autoethanogenum]|nr:hypothetical protein [Clostridium autoethanogenum]